MKVAALERDRINTTGNDLVVPRTEDGYEPFHAVYRRETCQLAVRQALEAGERKLISWYPSVKIEALEREELLQFDPEKLAFWHVNTPEELHRAEQLAETLS